MIIATAGHVDHGKTALIRALTGQETDRTEEERRRGLTIELGYAWLDLPDGQTVDFVDVPGHARFMRTLVAGVSCVDGVMLVVAADDGAMPQTLEHIELVRLLGLPLELIVITKCGQAEPARVQSVAASIRQLITDYGLAQPPLHRVDSLDGVGIESLRDALMQLARRPPSAPRPALLPRMLIDRHFSVPGIGQIVTGTLAQGALAPGDRLVLSDGGVTVKLRGLQVHGQAVERVQAGQRCAVNLTGDLPPRIERGVQLIHPDVYQPTSRLDAQLHAMIQPMPRQLQLHLAGAVVNARMVPLRLNDEAGSGNLVQIILEQPVSCRCGDRFVLRDPAGQRLVAGGRVLDPFAPDKGRHHSSRGIVLNALQGNDPFQQLGALLSGLPTMLDLGWYQRVTQLAQADIGAALARVADVMELDRAGRLICRAALIAELVQKLLETLAQWHRTEPSLAGMAVPQLARMMALPTHDLALRRALRRCLDTGALVQRGALLALADFIPDPDPEAARMMQLLEPDFTDAAPRPPVLGDIMQRLGWARDQLVAQLEHLTAKGQLVRVGRNRYLTPPGYQQLHQVARQLSQTSDGAGFSTAEFRDASGVGRNHSVAILESFDRQGLTRRLPQDQRLAL